MQIFSQEEHYSEMLKKDLELYNIARTIPFKSIKPLNYNQARETFLKAKGGNVIFQYQKIADEQLLDIIEKLEQLNIDTTSTIGKILDNKRIELISKTKMILSRGNEEFTYYSKLGYGEPTKELVDEAYNILNTTPKRSPSPKYLKQKQAIKLLKTVLKGYKLDWKVEKREMVTDASVNITDKILYLNNKIRFSQQFIRRLIVHEIGAHVLRAENGRLQPFLIFSTGFPGYLETEEGLAAYLESQLNVLNPAVLRNYAGRVLAVHFALESSFEDTFEKLRRFFPPKVSFKLASRAKRGLMDTSFSGAFTRDHIYLQGFLKVKEYAQKNGNVDALMYGKIGLKDVDLLHEIPRLREPTYTLKIIRDITKHKFLSLYD